MAPGGWDPKKCASACAIHESNWLNFWKKIFFDPPTPMVRPSPNPGHDQGGRTKIPSDMFNIFHLWEDTQN